MSTPVALPAPRMLRLPRVRFKRPRWPKGNRLWLVLAALNLGTIGCGVVAGDGRLDVFAVFLLALNIGLWWRSRDDDDGPSAT